MEYYAFIFVVVTVRNDHADKNCCRSVTKLCPTLCDLMNCSMPGFCPSLSPGVCSNLCPLSWWCHPTISSSVTPFSSWPPSSPASRSFLMSQFFTSGGQSIGASASASSPSNEYSGLISFDWLVWSPRSPKDSQESSPTPQFKSFNYSALSLLYRPPLTSIHDYWKNHSFDHMDLCWQSEAI